MTCGHAGRNDTPPTLRTHNTCSGRSARLAETSNATIGRVAQHGPDSRALPPSAGFARRDAFGVEPSGNLADAEAIHRVHLIDALDHRSEEHTSELQSLRHLVCRLLLE